MKSTDLESKDAIFLDLSSQEADVAALLQLTGSSALVFTLSFTLIVTQWINNLPYSAYFSWGKIFSEQQQSIVLHKIFAGLQIFEDAQYYSYGRTRLWHTDYSHKWKWAGSRETRYGQQKAKSRVRVGPWR